NSIYNNKYIHEKYIGGEKIKSKSKIIEITVLTITISTLLLISLSSTSAAEHNITNSTVGGLNKTVAESTDGDLINLENGIYTDNITNIIIDKNLTIKGGENRENTILNAQQLGRIFYINPGNTLTLINITIINGYANSGGGQYLTMEEK
ncbi:hypothetical protein, partial [Methanobrevibacter arboriphilus]|uniref:hypothetical protein n=1 Tax=Methanobrevibacter arboriphilus TaxID=39441 RepID=UPI000B0A1D63